MTFEQYLANGGDREEKLVTIYKIAPEKLSPEYRGLLTAMESNNRFITEHFREHDLYGALLNWDRIRSDLEKQGAEFV